MSGTTKKRAYRLPDEPAETEDYSPAEENLKKKKAMSAIQNKADFTTAYPDIDIKWGEYDIPCEEALSEGVIYEMAKSLGHELIKCSRAVYVDNESSRYPYVYEMLKYLVRFCDAHYRLKNVVIDPEDKELLVESFVSNSEEELAAGEELSDTIMRWEQHLKRLRGPMGTFGYVEFCVERESMVKLLVEVKQIITLENNRLSTCAGFYQACAELARAQVENSATAKAAYDEAEKGKSPTASAYSSQKEFNKALRDFKVAHKKGCAAAGVQAAQEPIFLALTDFSKWLFLKLQGKCIRVSEVFTIFPKEGAGFVSSPPFRNVLQYLAHGLSISPSMASFQGKVDMILAYDTALDKELLLSMYSEAVIIADAFLTALPSAAKDHFLARYPEAEQLWELIIQSRHEAMNVKMKE